MALSDLQREICKLLAGRRIEVGESYLAGASALNELLGADRLSRDLDLFHDVDEAVAASFAADRELLRTAGFEVRTLRERKGYVEAEIARRGEMTRVEWVRDSSFRFFPLVEHPELGLVLHPFDLATNKVLALVGRLEARDWIDVIECDRRLQPFGYLAWAACGKDPGYSPAFLVERAARQGRYSASEIDELDFAGDRPDPGELSRRWHALIEEARLIVETLPAEAVGCCVLDRDHTLCHLDSEALKTAVRAGSLHFHPGRIGGALPTIKPR
jgi:hypothetical protein